MQGHPYKYQEQSDQNEQVEWPQYTLEDVAQHKREDDGWIVYKDKIYNLSGAIHQHPGPISCILVGLGTDMTRMINQKHPSFPIERMLAKLQIGVLKK